MSIQSEHFDTQRLNAIPITGVAQRLGDTLRRAGSVHKVLCPWHDDTRPSLTLYERTDENRCHCFSCGKGGSVIDYVMQHEGWTFQEACRWLSRQFGISTAQASGSVPRPRLRYRTKAPQPAYTYIPDSMLAPLRSADSSLCRCLMQMCHPEAVRWMADEYQLGCYSLNGIDDYTVFPSIDHCGRVCNLKVQHYDADSLSPRFAHSDRTTLWLGALWAREGKLPRDAVFRSSCLFGEHLLARYPNSMVALVESPKNALFGALAMPQLLWLAAGSKSMLKRETLLPLQGRDVIVIPDRDAVEQWSDVISTLGDVANFTVSDFCRREAPCEDEKFDIADYLQRLWQPSKQS
ncbi:MAG: DUF6371 domain-containing protein [Bacteroidales bacterium]|nr:DUF6371 domain-containing protein [Bacteroidales bacterium]